MRYTRRIVQESLNDILQFVVFEESRHGGEKKTGILVPKRSQGDYSELVKGLVKSKEGCL